VQPTRRAFLAAAAAAALGACTGPDPTPSDRTSGAATAPTSPAGPAPAATPRPPAPARARGPARAVFSGPRTGRQVALTFHGSGDPALVRQLLDVAAQAGAPISVFVVGRWLEAHPDLAGRILAGGHELDNHTYTHPVLGQVPRPGVAAEIRRCRDVLTWLTGSGGRYFRPSGMTAPTPMVLAEAGAAGYPLVVGFDVDPHDYADPGADAIATRVTAALRAGSIVSLHTGHAGTVAALPRILTALRTRGLQPVTLRDLLRGGPSAP